MEGAWHLASKMVSKICMNTYTFVRSANLQIDAPYKWLQKFSQFFLCGLVGGTVVHYCSFLLSLPIFQVPAAFPTPIQHFSHSITPSSPLLPWILLSYTCMHLHTPSPHLPLSCQGEEVERQRAQPSGSWCFIFFKSLSGLVVCMADSLDLIPGLIQSLFQISLVHHAMAQLRCPCVYY